MVGSFSVTFLCYPLRPTTESRRAPFVGALPDSHFALHEPARGPVQ